MRTPHVGRLDRLAYGEIPPTEYSGPVVRQPSIVEFGGLFVLPMKPERTAICQQRPDEFSAPCEHSALTRCWSSGPSKRYVRPLPRALKPLECGGAVIGQYRVGCLCVWFTDLAEGTLVRTEVPDITTMCREPDWRNRIIGQCRLVHCYVSRTRDPAGRPSVRSLATRR